MYRSRFAWWPLHRRRGRLAQEPGAAMFQGLRVSLTLWYCVVLGSALVLFGVALYFGVQYSLLTPIENDAAGHARAHVGQWLSESPFRGACPLLAPYAPPGQFGAPSGQPFTMNEIVVCREVGLIDGPARYRYCQWRHSWIDLPLCAGGSKPKGEWICGRSTDWRIDSGAAKRTIAAAQSLARYWGSGTARCGIGWAVPGESRAGTGTTSSGSLRTPHTSCARR